MTGGRGRVLGVDLGDVRIGLAISDPLGLTAQPLGRLPAASARDRLARLAAIVRERDVVRVVVGHPLLLSGEAGTRARASEAFVERLRGEVACPVDLWDERLTTAQAERALIEGDVRRGRRREVVDAAAAAILLQSWLDAHPD